MWVVLALFSAVCLGMYDVFRKVSLKENAVLPVLFLASSTGAIIFLTILFFSRSGIIPESDIFFIPHITLTEHILFFAKACLVGSSWFFAYYAISKLPLTIVIPIRATGPMWTLVGAVIIFAERFNSWQWVGIVIVLGFFYYFSLAGKSEGIHFTKNKGIFAIVIATFLGAASSLYDKFLIPQHNRMAVQAWFSIYMILFLLPFLMIKWYPKRNKLKFRWTPFIILIGVFLIIADFLYFYALSMEGSKIAIISVLRRSSVVISFVTGALVFGEKNLKRKFIALVGILIGILFIVLSTV